MKPLSKFATSVSIFTLAAAPIGWVGYWIALTVISFSVGSTLLSLLFFGILMSYLMGGIPAIIAGMVFGIIIARKRLNVLLGAAVGFIAGVVSVFVYFYGMDIYYSKKLGYFLFGTGIPGFNFGFEIVGIGGFAGAVCGYLTNWIINRKQPRDLSSSNAPSHAA